MTEVVLKSQKDSARDHYKSTPRNSKTQQQIEEKCSKPGSDKEIYNVRSSVSVAKVLYPCCVNEAHFTRVFCVSLTL